MSFDLCKSNTKEIPESSRLEFLEKILANNFVLSDGEDNTTWLLKREVLTDLTLLRIVLAIHQKFWRPSFLREVIDLFVSLAYASSRTLLQRLLAYLKFPLESEDLFCWCKQKKIISMNYSSSTSSWKPCRWVRFDLILRMRDIYINSNLNPLTKSPSSGRSTELKDILPRNISQMVTKAVPSAQE